MRVCVHRFLCASRRSSKSANCCRSFFFPSFLKILKRLIKRWGKKTKEKRDPEISFQNQSFRKAHSNRETTNERTTTTTTSYTLLATSAARSLLENNSSSCMLSMTSSDAATSAHCVVMAQSLRHRKPWIFNASKGSSRSAKSPRAEVRPPLLLFVVEIVEIVEDTNGVVVVLAVIFWRPSNRHERNKRTCWVVQERERETEDTKSTPIKWGMISNERKNSLFF